MVKRRRKSGERTRKSTVRKTSTGPYCVYMLKLLCRSSTRTYVGMTNDFKRRLRQHNGEIVGGAKYTRISQERKDAGVRWIPVCRVCGLATKRAAAQLEWRLHHPRNPKANVSVLASRLQLSQQSSVRCERVRKRCIDLCNAMKMDKWTSKSELTVNTTKNVYLEWNKHIFGDAPTELVDAFSIIVECDA